MLDVAIQRAQWLALKSAPYAAQAFAAANFVVTDRLPYPTTACDKRWNVYVHPEMLTITTPLLARMLLHEVLGHLVREHCQQTIATEAKPRRANIAQDLEIESWSWDAPLTNSLEGGVTPSQYKLPSGKLWSWYYDHLPTDSCEDTDNDNPKGRDCGSGSDGVPRPYEIEGGISKSEAHAVSRTTAEAIRSYAGTVPEGLKIWADAKLAPPKIDWRARLRSRLSQSQARGKVARTGVLRQRRTKMLMRKWRQPSLHVALLCDTSGSMNGEGSRVLSEAASILASTGRLDCYWCDTEVHIQRGVRHHSQFRPVGGGGTVLAPLIEALGKTRYDVAVLITDALVDFPAASPPTNLLTLVLGEGKCPWPHIRV